MGRHAYNARMDGTHNARRRDFEECGCTVLDTHAIRIPGFPDFIVGCIGVNHLVECKDLSTDYGRAGLNANQQHFARDWNGGPVFVVGTQSDVIELVKIWRTRKTVMT
jgi:hypothetical protein